MINLPVSGSRNWGQQLNGILSSLDNRLLQLENVVNDTDSDSAIVRQIGCTSSGVAPKCYSNITYGTLSNWSCTATIDATQFSVYVGGIINTYFKHITSDNTFTATLSFGQAGYYYVYLMYDPTTSEDPFSLVPRNKLDSSVYGILVDLVHVTANNTIPTSLHKYFISTKTPMQHRDEMQRRYVSYTGQLQPNYDNLELTSSTWTVSSTTFLFSSNVLLYADGYYDENQEESYHTQSSVTFTTPYLLVDSDDTTQFQTGAYVFNENLSRVFRALITVDGKFIIQRAALAGVSASGSVDSTTMENIVRSTTFCNDLTNVNLEASDWVEIRRFYVTSSTIFSYAPVNNGYVAGNTNTFALFSSHCVDLGAYTLCPSSISNVGVQIQVNSNTANVALSLDATKYGANSVILTNNSSNLGSLKIEIDANRYISTSDNGLTIGGGDNLALTGNLNVSGISNFSASATFAQNITGTRITLSDGIYMTSDVRLKKNIAPLVENCLDIINQVSVYNYTYLENDQPQIGIMAQDFEKAMPKNCIVDTVADYKTLRENKLIFILWKALQEESAARQRLEQRVSELAGE